MNLAAINVGLNQKDRKVGFDECGDIYLHSHLQTLNSVVLPWRILL